MGVVDNRQDILDSRDIIERLEELEELKSAGEEYDEDELTALQDLAEECEGFDDWEYGATLIRESYFEDYARELAEDIGAITGDESWPLNCIDWEKAAEQLGVDYSEVTFDGVTYFIR